MVRDPRQERARQTVEVVIEATSQLLREGGQVSTNRIAKRAGVSIGSLYQYFENKEAIILKLAVLRREEVLRRLTRQLQQSPLQVIDGAVIDGAVLGFIDALGEDPELQVALTREVVRNDLRRVVGELPAASMVIGMFIRLLKLDVPCPEMAARILVTSVAGSVHGALLEDPALLCDPAFRGAMVSMVRRTLGIP